MNRSSTLPATRRKVAKAPARTFDGVLAKAGGLGRSLSAQASAAK